MPFTPSHVAAVLPAMRVRFLDGTALAIGAMAPDFQYFLYGRREGQFSHSLVGLFAFDLPITLALAVLFHLRIKWLLLDVVPRAASLARRPWKPNPIVVVACALAGTITHLVWDGFTHADAFGVDAVPALQDFATVPLLGRIPLHRVLQHVSSVVGLLVVLVALALALRRATRGDFVPARRTLAAIAGVTLVALAALGTRLVLKHSVEAGNVVVASITAILVGILGATLLLRRRIDEIRAALPPLDPV